MALARLFGPAARRRLEQASWLNAVCQSGVAVLLFGGAWVSPAGSAVPTSPAVTAMVFGGLAIFLFGFLAQLSIGILGWPLFLLPKGARTHEAGNRQPGAEDAVRRNREAVGDSRASAVASDGEAQLSVHRDKDDSYARLRRYNVYVDGRRVGGIRPGEACSTPIAAGVHTVQVKISWCSSPVLSVEVPTGGRKSLRCRAIPGAESDPAGVVSRRHELLVLR